MTQKEFYRTKAWQHCRESYLASVAWLCEDCAARGVLTPAEIVHHRTHLDDDNVNDPTIALAHANLKAVCRKCHGMEHKADPHHDRYLIDASGNLLPRT